MSSFSQKKRVPRSIFAWFSSYNNHYAIARRRIEQRAKNPVTEEITCLKIIIRLNRSDVREIRKGKILRQRRWPRFVNLKRPQRNKLTLPSAPSSGSGCACNSWDRCTAGFYCKGGGVMPTNVVPRNLPFASKFQLKNANPALAQAWHPLRSG